MKTIIFTLVFVTTFFSTSATTDSYRWLHAQSFNGMQATGMTVDDNINTYFYGFSYHDIKYGTHTTTIDYETDNNAIVIIKVNALHEYQWTKKVHVESIDSSGSFNVRAMDVDSDGNMYFGGGFSHSITVNSQIYDVGSSNGYFLMKTNANGDILWFKAGSASRGHIYEIKHSAGRIGFLLGWETYIENRDLFGTDVLEKFGSTSNFDECERVVGALSVTDGSINFAQGMKTQHAPGLDQLFGQGVGLSPRNTLDADSQGNFYVTGGFKTNTLRVAGTEYQTVQDMASSNNQFVLRVDVFGGISWVKLLTNISSSLYPSLAVNDDSGVAVLIDNNSNNIFIDDQEVSITGDASKKNHIALFRLNGEFYKNHIINTKVRHITPSSNGSFCVAGNIEASGQYFGMDGLYNPDPERENLFVGFLDRDLKPIAGQSVISTGRYLPTSLITGSDGKIKLLGQVNYTSENESDIFPFGEFDVSYRASSENHNTCIYSVLDPKQLIKADIMTYPSDCKTYMININPSLDSKVEWYINDELVGTDFELTSNDMGGYEFEKGVYYMKAVLTDSTDNTNTLTVLDTIGVYEPVININTEIFPETGLVNYSVTISDYADEYSFSFDRGNYNYDPENKLSGSYVYEPGTYTLVAIVSTQDNWNCHQRAEKKIVIPERTILGDECKQGAIRGHVESTIAQFLAGEIRIDLFRKFADGMPILFIKSDTIDSEGLFSLNDLDSGNYILRASIMNPENYPELLVTYFNIAVNQVFSWQQASPIRLGCNKWADIDLTFAAIEAVMNGTGSISGLISYSALASRSSKGTSIRASSMEGDVLMSNVPILLRRKSNGEIVSRTVTDENGLYTLKNLLEDEYEIVVDIPGIAMQTTHKVILTAGDNNAENRNFIVTNTGINATDKLGVVAFVSGSGTISNLGTNMLDEGGSIEFTITPDDNQSITDVFVNGESVGPVNNYKFSGVVSNQTIQVVFSMTSKITDTHSAKLNIYPNPTTHSLTISLQTNASYSLLTVNGQVIKEGHLKEGKNTLNISKLSKGLYFLKVKTKEGVSSKKIIKD